MSILCRTHHLCSSPPSAVSPASGFCCSRGGSARCTPGPPPPCCHTRPDMTVSNDLKTTCQWWSLWTTIFMSCRGNLFQHLFKMSGSAIAKIGLFYKEKALVVSSLNIFVYRCQNCGTPTVGVRCLPGLHNYWLLAIKHSCTSKSDSLPVGLIGMTNNNSNQNNPPDLLFKRNFWGTFVNICIFLFQRRAAFYY